MKKTNYLLIAVALFFSGSAFSQDQALLSVTLTDIQTITVNAGQETVSITMDTASEYTDGTDVDQTDHLAVVCTSGFDVTATAGGDLTETSTSAIIPISTVTLQASAGTGAPTDPGIAYPSAPLVASTAVNLITGVPADLDAKYNVNYALSGGTDYLNADAGTYEATITYTLVPQ